MGVTPMAEATSHGLDVRGATVAQMRVLLKQIRLDQGTAKPKPTIKGLSTMKKAELVALAKEKGIPNAETTTVEELKLRLQGWTPEAAAATGKVAQPTKGIQGDNKVGFGKHRTKTYREVLREMPQSASWVVAQPERPECSSQHSRQSAARCGSTAATAQR